MRRQKKKSRRKVNKKSGKEQTDRTRHQPDEGTKAAEDRGER